MKTKKSFKTIPQKGLYYSAIIVIFSLCLVSFFTELNLPMTDTLIVALATIIYSIVDGKIEEVVETQEQKTEEVK
jgi:hypothetical protein